MSNPICKRDIFLINGKKQAQAYYIEINFVKYKFSVKITKNKADLSFEFLSILNELY